MNLLVVGASYRSTPVVLLERLVVPPAEVPAMLTRLLGRPFVGEAVVLSTCNRVEVYAVVTGFHGGLADVCAALAERSGASATELAPHLYVHYDDDAVTHAFRVTTGLDSMIVGEPQILGQLRDAYLYATELDTAGRLLHELMQQALRVGKRAHTETGIDRAGQNVVTAALAVAAQTLGGGLAGRPALVLGAGSMGALAVATLSRAGATPISVANRGADRVARLAEAYKARYVPMDRLPATLAEVDVVVAATAAVEPMLTVDLVSAAVAARAARGGDPLVILDLAVPRDAAPGVAELPGVHLVDIDTLASTLREGPAAADTLAVERIVAAEVETFLGWLRGADVAPTVAALRARADDVVETELRRLSQRRPELTDEQRADVAHAFHRVVQRLLHSPTVRVRQLAAETGGDRYAALLRELFDLDIPHPAQAGDVPDLFAGQSGIGAGGASWSPVPTPVPAPPTPAAATGEGDAR